MCTLILLPKSLSIFAWNLSFSKSRNIFSEFQTRHFKLGKYQVETDNVKKQVQIDRKSVTLLFLETVDSYEYAP